MTEISFSALPKLGAELDGGTFCGVTTHADGRHVAVILLPNKAQERMTWEHATKLAADAGGQLPSRPVAALLYATVKDRLQPTWHWTCEEYTASSAWYCDFSHGGYQSYGHKSYEGGAVAVRLIQLTA